MVDQDATKDENMKDVNEKAEKQDINQKDDSQEDANQKHKKQKDVNQKEETQKDANQTEEQSMSGLWGSDTSKDPNENKNEDSIPEEKLSVSPNGECTEKSLTAKELDIVVSDDRGPSILSKSSNSDLPKDYPPNSVRKSDNLTSKVGLLPSPMMELGEGVSVKDHSQQSEATKNVGTMPTSLPLQTKEAQQPIASNTLVEKGANTGIFFKLFLLRSENDVN